MQRISSQVADGTYSSTWSRDKQFARESVVAYNPRLQGIDLRMVGPVRLLRKPRSWSQRSLMTASGRSLDSAEQKLRKPFVRGADNRHSIVFCRHYVVSGTGTIGEDARP